MNKIYTNKQSLDSDALSLGISVPYSDSVSVLRQESMLYGKRVANRLACQAMEGCDGEADGSPGELTVRRYHRLARGGAGILWFEATAALPEGKANPRQLCLNKSTLDSFRRLIDSIRETAVQKNGYAPLIIMQSTHSGRYSKPYGTMSPLIAYHNPLYEANAPIDDSRIVSDSYLDRVTEALIQSAYLAEQAGFDGVDIKCCHGYLNAELLSAHNRKGRYGGDFENRTRLLRESIQGAMQVCRADFALCSRLGIYDGLPYPYGFGVTKDTKALFDPSEPVRLLQSLSDSGVELINITMGNPYFNPHINRPFCRGAYTSPEHPLQGVMRILEATSHIKRAVPQIKILSSALSFLGSLSPNIASAYIQNGDFDYAGYGRMIFAYPNFARDILQKGALEEKLCCIACSKCTEIMRAGGTAGCPVRDSEIYAPIYQKYCGGKS